MAKKVDSFQHQFSALRGFQAGRAFYVAMCPLGLVPELFKFTDEEDDPIARAQRKLNKARIPELADYMIENPKDYVFSALTASVDGRVEFRPVNDAMEIGTLVVPMKATFVINDGQHRRAAIEEALKREPRLQDETIPVVLFLDVGLKRKQQMFADLNKNAVRPTKSLGILYDHRDELSQLAQKLMSEVPLFQMLTETEKSTISNRSRNLFTLSTIYFATRQLLNKRPRSVVSIQDETFARQFWIEVCNQMKDWQDAADRNVSSADLRRDYIHAHGVGVQAIALAGAALREQQPKTWKRVLAKLGQIDWHRRNRKLWEGRATVAGRMNKSSHNVLLTANFIKGQLGVTLSTEEQEAEDIYGQGKH